MPWKTLMSESSRNTFTQARQIVTLVPLQTDAKRCATLADDCFQSCRHIVPRSMLCFASPVAAAMYIIAS